MTIDFRPVVEIRMSLDPRRGRGCFAAQSKNCDMLSAWSS